jgi:Fe-S-cluster containining protein
MKCKQCGNCCRCSIIEDVTWLDLEREPRLLDAVKELKCEYDGKGDYRQAGERQDKQWCIPTPCKMLTADNKCSIYPTRPNICVAHAGGQFCAKLKLSEARMGGKASE